MSPWACSCCVCTRSAVLNQIQWGVLGHQLSACAGVRWQGPRYGMCWAVRCCMLLPCPVQGIGVHHSGLLPILKELVEILFQEQLLKVGSACCSLASTDTAVWAIYLPFASSNLGLYNMHCRRLLPHILCNGMFACAVPVCHGDVCDGAEHASEDSHLHRNGQVGRHTGQWPQAPGGLLEAAHMCCLVLLMPHSKVWIRC